jgi:hypothetical protein
MTRWEKLWRPKVSDCFCVARRVEYLSSGSKAGMIGTHLNSGSWPGVQRGVAGEVEAGIGETQRKRRLCACLACRKLLLKPPQHRRGHRIDKTRLHDYMQHEHSPRSNANANQSASWEKQYFCRNRVWSCLNLHENVTLFMKTSL